MLTINSKSVANQPTTAQAAQLVVITEVAKRSKESSGLHCAEVGRQGQTTASLEIGACIEQQEQECGLASFCSSSGFSLPCTEPGEALHRSMPWREENYSEVDGDSVW